MNETPDREPADRRVLVVVGHRSLGEALAVAIDSAAGLRCVGVVGRCDGLLAAVAQHRPEVVLLVPQPSGLAADVVVQRLRALDPDLPVLALAELDDRASVLSACHAGARAFLDRDCSFGDVASTLRTLGPGPCMIDAATFAALSTPPSVATVAGVVHLTPREREVLGLLGRAQDARRIARDLGVSLHTVRGYVKTLLHKLDAHSQLEAVVRARELGLLDADTLEVEPTTLSVGSA